MWLIRSLIWFFVIFEVINQDLSSTVQDGTIFHSTKILTTSNRITSTYANRETTLHLLTTAKNIKSTRVSSVNKPKFSRCALWNSNGITIANSTSIGLSPFSAFIDINNTLYVTDQTKKTIQVWSEKNNTLKRTIFSNFTVSVGLFVTITGDIYVDNDNNSHISKWSSNATYSNIVLYIKRGCNSLFITIDDILYCSINNGHLVIKTSLNSNISIFSTAAGTGCAGSAANMLDQPFGIYVDVNLDLYVADTENDRIQLFHDEDLNGTTLVGKTGKMSFILDKPTSVMLDGDGYLFIVDSGSQRIIRSGPDGSECIIGCSMPSCSLSNQLCTPLTAIFDSDGNIFVTNQYTNGIQKFLLSNNTCDETSTSLVETSTMIKEQETTSQYIQSTTSPIKTTKHFINNSIINQTCSPPDIKLFPPPTLPPSPETPLTSRRGQDFYITSSVTLKCRDSLAIKIKWSIFNYTLNGTIQTKIDHLINTTFSELFIPENFLIYGLYEFKVTVTMIDVPDMFSLEYFYVKIVPSGITANLVKFGTSVITSGEDQDLILDPGIHSFNPDESVFNASDWTYEYQCRLYDPSNMGNWFVIENTSNSCFSNRTDNMQGWQYNLANASQSSVTIFKGSLKYNHKYQFRVYMVNRRNLTSQATGYVLIQIENTRPQMVAIVCVIVPMCPPNIEFQYINPSTQVALYSECVSKCDILTIHWNIYQGLNDSSTMIVNWIPFNQTNSSQNLHFYGVNTSSFTANNTLFDENSDIIYWRFEVVYTFPNENSSSSLNFIMNQRLRNGTCSIDPHNGTTSTIFTINCTGWIDEANIKDYTLYYWIAKSSEQVMLIYTVTPTFKIRLPAGNDDTSLLNLTIHIRDQRNCVTEYHMEPIIVIRDDVAINSLINVIKNPNQGQTDHPIVEALASGNQNTIGQIVVSLSQEFNKQNQQNIESAIANGISATSISVSSLNSKIPSKPRTPTNGTISNEYIETLNTAASLRDYLMKVTTNLQITNIDSIKLQASSLAQLTESINELTQTSSLLASTKCYQLALTLKTIAMRVSYEDAQFACTQIAHCINNALTAINAPLQQRGIFLNDNSINENINSEDYDIDMEFIELTSKTLAFGDEFSSETLEKDRIIYYQKKIANQIAKQASLTLSLISKILNIHLNIGQKLTINSESLLISLETLTIESLINKKINNVQIHIPSNLTSKLPNNATISLRSIMQPLAPNGASQFQANTNMSTIISLSLLDQYENEISINTNLNQPIEFFISRDSNIILPEMKLQNVISINIEEIFYFNLIDLKQFIMNDNLTVSLHFEIRPLNTNLNYLFIYEFDDTPQLNSSKSVLFCSSNLSNDSIYTYFIDNRQVSRHKSVIFGLRELNLTDIEDDCEHMSISNSLILDKSWNFTENYELRIYTSGCYYLDEYNNWQSDGLWVGPLTNHYKTQCFSTHLTTFASSFQDVSFSFYENNSDYQLKDKIDLGSNSTQFNQFLIDRECSFNHIDQLYDINHKTSDIKCDPF